MSAEQKVKQMLPLSCVVLSALLNNLLIKRSPLMQKNSLGLHILL